ncbi:MAG: DUF1501 domain-containing protein [Acidobacteriota bacterium]
MDRDRFLNRRAFLQLGGMSLAMTLADSSVARDRFNAGRGERTPGRRFLGDTPTEQLDTPTLVLIFLRGGADGLNQTIPTNSEDFLQYNMFRPNLSPYATQMDVDMAGGRLLDGMGADTGWAVHPQMVEHFMPLWEQGAMAFSPDVHYDAASRSHFDGQQFYENGTPGEKFTPNGWMNRHLESNGSSAEAAELRGIALNSVTPLTMRGDFPTLSFSTLGNLSVTGNDTRNEAYLTSQELAFGQVATGPKFYDGPVGYTGGALIDALRAIREAEDTGILPDPDPAAEAIYPYATNNGFAVRLRDTARLIKSNAFNIEIAQVELGGWDTHRDQDTIGNNHPLLSWTLMAGLRAFYEDLGATYGRNVVTVAITEFGRTSRENGSIGTDHGSAMTSFVVGRPETINGRRVFHGSRGVGGWHGLNDLRNNRDLKYSVDYRDLLMDVIGNHLGNESSEIFPGFSHDPLGIIA